MKMTSWITVRLCRHLAELAEAAGIVTGTILALLMTAATAVGQPPLHPQHAGVMPPGAIGSLRLQQGGPLPGYFQPVEVTAPNGAKIATCEQGDFTVSHGSQLRAGMLISRIYRLKVTEIPNQAGEEIYPTIELIDRLYPPSGQAWRHAIPVPLTQEELELALAGNLVTRVIYLEDPEQALPDAQARGDQNWFEAAAGDDPLMVADRLGRPVAILRIGGRLPSPAGPEPTFLFGSPPLIYPETGQH